MTTYYSTYWNAYIASYIDNQTGDLRTFIATSRGRAIEKALSAIYNNK